MSICLIFLWFLSLFMLLFHLHLICKYRVFHVNMQDFSFFFMFSLPSFCEVGKGEAQNRLILFKDIYNCFSIACEFRKRFIVVQNTRVLRVFCKMLSINMLALLIEMNALFDVKTCCHLHQITMSSASKDVVIPFTLRSELRQFAP